MSGDTVITRVCLLLVSRPGAEADAPGFLGAVGEALARAGMRSVVTPSWLLVAGAEWLVTARVVLSDVLESPIAGRRAGVRVCLQGSPPWVAAMAEELAGLARGRGFGVILED